MAMKTTMPSQFKSPPSLSYIVNVSCFSSRCKTRHRERDKISQVFPNRSNGFAMLVLNRPSQSFPSLLKCYISREQELFSDFAKSLGRSQFTPPPTYDASSASELLLLPNLVEKVFPPVIFEASKLDVMFLGVTVDAHPENLPRIYTLTHNDITAMLTLTISQRINKAQLQGWYKRLQRDDVIAVWRKCQGSMSLHVHCHISHGGHWFLEAFARLRFNIFKRELPVVLEAFRHGDQALLMKHPELDKAPVWVYFHSNVKEFDRIEYWGPLEMGGQPQTDEVSQKMHHEHKKPVQCKIPCDCCFPR